ncbi:hypothetical protein [Heyndrickxia oleronia]|uniref:hypothetical protein n=1 Tax=Heyndrickxia oleronia TaxID=38875 RepID=UPI001B1E6E35|nr:hypothetical protein [Heyndrickxia oleronia]GIN39300.1 hypothetical protein J19TS1_22490 [Heyndrickxia oleronia]
MSLKGKRIIGGIGGVFVLIILFIFIMTWCYPYSPFSVKKNYAFQPYKVLHNGKTFREIFKDFKGSYENDLKDDLNNKVPNLTIDRTQYVLPIFEQDWLVSKNSISIDKMKLDTMLFEVKQVRGILLSLLVQVDYTSEQRGYLVNNIKDLLLLEEDITYLKNGSYLSRNELNRRLRNLAAEFTKNFDSFVTFYERSH